MATTLISATLLALLPQALAVCQCFKIASGEVFTERQILDFREGKPSNFDTFFAPLNTPYAGETVQNQMTSDNVIFHPDHLELVTKKKLGVQTSADIESLSELHYGSFRARFSVTGSPGAVAGFFTYKESGDENEQDIEILTNEAHNQIHYVNHGGGEENPNFNATMDADWTQFSTHRFDWTPTASHFFVDDWSKPKTLTEGMPTLDSALILNMWSSGQGWGGEMEEGGSASMKVQWIQVYHNLRAGGSGATNEKRSGFHGRRQAGEQADVCTQENTCNV